MYNENIQNPSLLPTLRQVAHCAEIPVSRNYPLLKYTSMMKIEVTRRVKISKLKVTHCNGFHNIELEDHVRDLGS